MAKPMPPNPKRSNKKIGRPVKIFRRQDFQRPKFLGWLILIFILFSGFFIFGLWRTYDGYTHFGPVAAWSWGRVWFAVSGICVLILIWLIIFYRKKKRQGAAIFANGLGIITSNGHKKYFEWAEISGIAIDATRYNFLWKYGAQKKFAITVYPTTAPSFNIDQHFGDIENLATQIKKHVFPILLADLQTQFHAGRWIYFGAIHINRDFIRLGNKDFPWQEIKHIEVEKGSVEIEFKHFRRKSIPVSRIINLELFLDIIKDEIIIWE